MNKLWIYRSDHPLEYMLKGYIHSLNEASLVVHAVRLGLIKPVTQRLSPSEREEIESGSIYCFIKSENGMKRWTDGKIWSPSKILGHFLLYKEVPKHLSKSALKKNKSRRKTIEHENLSNFNADEFSMYKKTISYTHGDVTYHIVSYFQPIFDRHGIIEYPFFRSLNTAVINFPEILEDVFINEELSQENFKAWNLLPYESKYLMPNINRKDLEDITCDVLENNFILPIRMEGREYFIQKNKRG
ncbi:Gti1/Pac2 family protein [Spraguea lophii 42_110]|uniref:Gti1/Pac2 family protein n=1 Tax=Spraguea lophii (strain 42_110) TaxID=1358809 RepID=S7XJR7_SPRLO|nr:Gti1/Pac2 family protein [Spraguea lophii 42_110]